jgi:GTP diphosphokinase / guanosine-3',5'-bis(diphosphate) 3'-diphosphatase
MDWQVIKLQLEKKRFPLDSLPAIIKEMLLALPYLPPIKEIEQLLHAYSFAAEAHKGQKRLSGNDYIVHLEQTALILAQHGVDVATMTAGFLHDVLEDTSVTYEKLKQEFDKNIADLVAGVSKVGKYDLGRMQQGEPESDNLRKMFFSMAKDLRVVLIKLADRLHNMRTIEFLPTKSRISTSRETLDIFAPIAHRLGMAQIRWEMEDHAFHELHPQDYIQIAQKVAEQRAAREKAITELIRETRDLLNEGGIKAEVVGRPKHLYSIWSKMQRENLPFEEIYDLLAVRIIAESVKDCYGILGLVHSKWTPIPGRFRDYIAMPKPNMYRSLHTTVIHPSGKRVEVQIRTEEMNQEAEFGIAAHWQYKEHGARKATKSELDWLESLLEWQGEAANPREFLSGLQVELFADEIFVLTPKGKVVALPRGATSLDLAYHIHTDLGNMTTGARVNGRMVPLRTELMTGDVVEIVTSPGHEPSRDWLNLVRTSRARNKIKQFFKAQESELLAGVGKEILRKLLHRRPGGLNHLLDSKELKNYLAQRGFGVKELFYRIGNGSINPHAFLDELLPKPVLAPVPEAIAEPAAAVPAEVTEKILVEGLADVELRLAKCCCPRPGDAIMALVTRGAGVSIHRLDCGNIQFPELAPRLLSARFLAKVEKPTQVNLIITAEDRKGLLMDMIEIITEQGGDVSAAKVDVKDTMATLRFTVSVPHSTDLPKVRTALSMVEAVKAVRLEHQNP